MPRFSHDNPFFMSPEDPSKKRKTVRIHLQPKPAAPRHPHAVARAVSLPAPAHRSQKSCFVFPLVQVTVASFLAMTVLDEGECSHVVAYAALGYVGGLMMMVPRRDALTTVDEMLIRWGFVILFFISSLIAAIVWRLRMHGM
jgi:hypothetical protein